MTKEGSSFTVYCAIIGNFIVMISKFAGFFISGSGAMLSSGIHSFADVSNQSLLALGIKKSKRKPDKDHPYGFSRERFIWALISATGIFFVGCGITVYHGIHIILDPQPIKNYTLSFIILAISFIVELIVLIIALKHSFLDAARKKQTLITYLIKSSDPVTMAVILEDTAAIIGVIVVAIGIGLSYYTNNFIWDGIATLIVGILLGVVALALIAKTKGLLLGRALYEEDYRKTLDLLKNDKVINKIYDVKTMIMGSDKIRFKAEIDFNGKELTKNFMSTNCDLKTDLKKIKNESDFKKYLTDFGDQIVDKVGKEVNRIESKIKDSNPDIKHIDLETH